MGRSRREFLRDGGLAIAGATFGTRLLRASGEPALGLIFPPLNYPIPPDARRLYPKGVEFLSGGVGLPGGMTPEGYDEAIPRVLPAARRIGEAGRKGDFRVRLVAHLLQRKEVQRGARAEGHESHGLPRDDAEQRSRGRVESGWCETCRSRDRLHRHRHRAAEAVPARSTASRSPRPRVWDSCRFLKVPQPGPSCTSWAWKRTRILNAPTRS